jgi:squalene-hopene/tetraprenyl-beta-curcumene cyclase
MAPMHFALKQVGRAHWSEIGTFVPFSDLEGQVRGEVRDWIRGPFRSGWSHFFKHLDSVLRVVEPMFPAVARKRAIRWAVDFTTKRLNGEDGLGAIYPAMANTVMMFDTLGYPADHPDAAIAWASVRKLLVVEEDRAYCQPCLSPVWDTGLAGHAVVETDGATNPAVDRAAAWLRERQILDVTGDWAAARPKAPPGGWAFQYANPHYPDVDDTAVVGMLLHRHMQAGDGDPSHAEAIARARDWIVGMQSRGGGWGAFDADNDKMYLNHIPFADHGALLDPPTSDVTARCVSFLAQIGMPVDDPVMARGLAWLRREQDDDGSWFGRWGTNYIYGTWSVLCALNAAGVPAEDVAVRRAVGFLLATQREDGGWGEDNESYGNAPRGRYHRSNPSQMAWALLGLMAAGEGGESGNGTGDRLACKLSKAGWRVGRGTLYRRWVPARFVSALPRLPAVLPAAGAGALPQPAAEERYAPRCVGVLKARGGA